jgi:hypothetical protein
MRLQAVDYMVMRFAVAMESSRMLPIDKARHIGLAILQVIALSPCFLRALNFMWICKKNSYMLDSAILTKETVTF